MNWARQFSLAGLVYLAVVLTGEASAAVIIDLPDLESVSFFERSGNTPTEHIFGVNSIELTTRLSDPLGASNRDFIGTDFGADENYDVFYSNGDGSFNVNGEFITVTADYDFAGDSGLNLAGVRLNFVSGPGEFANSVASFVALGSSPFPATVVNAIDGSINTHTFLGDTVGQAERLSITVGFESTPIDPVPEPATLTVFSIGLGLMGLIGWCKVRRQSAQSIDRP